MDPQQQIETFQREFAEQTLELRSASFGTSTLETSPSDTLPALSDGLLQTCETGLKTLHQLRHALASTRHPHRGGLLGLDDWHTLNLFLAEQRTEYPSVDHLGLKVRTNGRVCSIFYFNCAVASVERLQQLPELESIKFEKQFSGDLGQLAGIPSLLRLSFSSNKLTSLQGIDGCVGLDELDLCGNSIRDLSPLRSLRQLEALELSHNKISDATPIYQITSLKKLSLGGNRLYTLGPISDLHRLQSLQLNNNALRAIDEISHLKNLTSLNLAQNYVSRLPQLIGLTNLRTLNLFDNQIEDLSPLRNLPNLQSLGVAGNPLSAASLHLLAELKERGVEITEPVPFIYCPAYPPHTPYP